MTAHAALNSPTNPPKKLRQTLLSFAPAATGTGTLTLQHSRAPDPPTGPPPGPFSAQARRALLLASDDTLRGKAAREPVEQRGGSSGGGRARGAGGGQPRAPPKQVPFEDLPPWQAVLRAPRMVVDRFGIDYVYCGAAHWFLTHFHADHYKGLSKHFNGGILYCTAVTAALVQLKLRVPPQNIATVPWDTPTPIAGVQVTMIDANHCPGAAMILFEPPNRLPIVRVWSCSCVCGAGIPCVCSGIDVPACVGIDGPACSGVDVPACVGIDGPACVGIDGPAGLCVDLCIAQPWQPLIGAHARSANNQLSSSQRPVHTPML